jgi:hypothetical protein
MKTIQIAPKWNEITRKENVFTCKFNNMDIKWCIAYDCSNLTKEDDKELKKCLSTAIAISSSLWRLPYLLNNDAMPLSEVYVNGEKVEYKLKSNED